MLAVNLDMSRLNVALVGRGMRAVRRLELLEEAGCRSILVYSDDPSPYLQVRAGSRLRHRLPSIRELSAARLVYLVDIDPAPAALIADIARHAGCLVNVEDRRQHCDFHSPSVVRRGDLVIGISTNGRCPGLARSLRKFLDRLFSRDWSERVRSLGERRDRLREAGNVPTAILRAVEREVGRLEPQQAGHNGPPPGPGLRPVGADASDAPASWAY